MATQVVTFAFGSSGDVTAWTFNAGDAAQARSFNSGQGSPTAGCLQTQLDGKNKNALNGDQTRVMTFEDMGVPANSTITGITGASMRSYVTTFTTGVSCQIQAILTPSGFADIQLSALRSPTAADGGWQTTTGPGASGLSIPSNTSCTLMMDLGQRTGNSNSAQIITLYDTLTFTIAYDPASTVYTKTGTSYLDNISDAASRALRRIRLSGDALATTDDAVSSALYRTRLSSDALLTTDEALQYVRLFRLTSDELVLIDGFIIAAVQQIHTKELDSLIASVVDGGWRKTHETITADPLDLSDEASMALRRQRSTDEAIDLIDAVAWMMSLRRQSDETLDIADEVARHLYRSRRKDEALDIADDTSRWLARSRIADDSLSVYDSGWKTREWVVFVDDEPIALWDDEVHEIIPGAGGQIYTKTGQSTIVDVTDQISYLRYLNRSVASTFTVTDAALAALWRSRLQSDAVAVADSILSSAQRIRDRLESITVDDDIAAHAHRGRVASDGLSLTDALIRYLLHSRSVDDALAVEDGYLSDYLPSGGLYVKTRQSTLEVLDEALRVVMSLRIQDDTITVTDATVRSAHRQRTEDENITLLDAMARAVLRYRSGSDQVEVADAASLHVIRNRLISDLADVTDENVATRLLRRSLYDAIVDIFDDKIGTKIGGAVITKTSNDGFLVTDSASRRLWARRTLDDPISVTDSRNMVIKQTRGDALLVGDEASYSTLYGRVASDTVDLSDEAYRFLHRLAILSDSFEISDGVLTARIVARRITELLDVEDSIDKTFTSGLAGIIDVRVRIGVSSYAVELGVDHFIHVGVESEPQIELGAYN